MSRRGALPNLNFKVRQCRHKTFVVRTNFHRVPDSGRPTLHLDTAHFRRMCSARLQADVHFRVEHVAVQAYRFSVARNGCCCHVSLRSEHGASDFTSGFEVNCYQNPVALKTSFRRHHVRFPQPSTASSCDEQPLLRNLEGASSSYARGSSQPGLHHRCC
jgi:hypothetical protein